MKKMTGIIIACVAVAAVVLVVVLVTGKRKEKETPMILDGGDTTVYGSYPELQGDWVQLDAYDPDNPYRIFIKSGNFSLTMNGETSAWDGFYISDTNSYGLELENSVAASFADGEGPYWGEMVYHTENHNGHTIGFLTAFLYECDGRGLIVGEEFVHEDDLQYLPDGFHSDLYHSLNDSEAVPTYVE